MRRARKARAWGVEWALRQAAEVEEFVGVQEDTWCFAGHRARSVCGGTVARTDAPKGTAWANSVQVLKCTRMSRLPELSCETQH